jgi:hypothetical protein
MPQTYPSWQLFSPLRMAQVCEQAWNVGFLPFVFPYTVYPIENSHRCYEISSVLLPICTVATSANRKGCYCSLLAVAILIPCHSFLHVYQLISWCGWYSFFRALASAYDKSILRYWQGGRVLLGVDLWACCVMRQNNRVDLTGRGPDSGFRIRLLCVSCLLLIL